jgi:hypothetical protein
MPWAFDKCDGNSADAMMRGESRRIVEALGMPLFVTRPKPFPGMARTARCFCETCRANLVKGKAEDTASAAVGVDMMLSPWRVRKFVVVYVQYSLPFLLEVQNGSCDHVG